jgi:hypothetical protein
MALMIENHHLQRASRPVGRQHVLVQIVGAAGIIVCDRKVQSAVAVEIGPLNPMGRPVLRELGRKRIAEPVTVVMK